MPAPLEKIKPIYKPHIEFKPEYQEERATIVHCTIIAAERIRVWPTTYLIQEDGTRKQLLQVYNLQPFPEWTWADFVHTFTMVFDGLDKSCRIFDLKEIIDQPGAFEVNSIKRNSIDVYIVDIDDL